MCMRLTKMLKNILLTGCLQLAQVTERQSGHTNRFCLGLAMNPDEH